MSESTAHVAVIEGIPCRIPNRTVDYGDYYVSYNTVDSDMYGGDTTALVTNTMDKFLILYGDHRAKYAELADKGYDACVEYFKAHIDQISKYSERP